MRIQPRVNEGMRAGRDAPGRVVPEGDRSDPGLYARISAIMRGKNLVVDRGEKTPWDVVFAARNSHHMVQVTAPEDIVDGKTGRKTRGRPVMVVFNNCLYSVPKTKYRKVEDAQMIVDWLRGHPNYKLDFWEQKDMANEAKIRQTVHVIESVSADPGIRETVLQYLTANDFVEDETKVSGLGSQVVGGDPDDEDEDEDFGDAEDQTGDVDPEPPAPPPAPKVEARKTVVAPPPVRKRGRPKRR